MSERAPRFPGRPPKEGFDYFSLYCDFFENDKIKALRRALGEVGLLTYLNLLTRIYGTHGYYYKCSDLDVLSQDIAEQIANDRLKRKTACVRETISYLICHGILDRDLAERGIISGIAMQEKYIEMACRARRKINMDVYLLVDVRLVISKFRDSAEEIPNRTEEMAEAAEEMQESKERIKEKEMSSLSPARARGKYRNVMLTNAEAEALLREGIPEEYIDHFSEKLRVHRYSYTDHCKAIRAWWRSDRTRWTELNGAGSDKPIRPPSEAEKRPGGRDAREPSASFDTDVFFETALRRSYGEAYDKIFGKGEDDKE